MTYIKQQANHRAYEIWEDARKIAANYQNITEWQRLNRATTALNQAKKNATRIH